MILVSVDSSRGRVTMTVPEDVSVEQLLPELVESVGLDPRGARWSLRPKAGSPLDGARTLSQSGVFEGAILVLGTEDTAPSAPGKPWAASWLAVARDQAGRGLEGAWSTGRHSLLPRLQAGVVAARSRLESRPERTGRASGPAHAPLERPAPPGARQPGLRDMDRLIATRRLAAGLLVAVVSEDAGAGATTVTALLATLLARLRTDQVIAVDTDASSGSLSIHLVPGRRVAALDLLSALSSGVGAGGLHQHLVPEKHGLQVLPAPILGGSAGRLDDQAYVALFHGLTRLARVTLVDCGQLDAPGARVAVEGADLAVVVCRSDPTALPWWDPNRRLLQRLVPSPEGAQRSAILVLNRARRAGGAAPDASSIPGARAAVMLADEPVAAARLRAAAFDWERAPRSWQTDVRRLAVALLSGQDAAAG